MTEPFVDCHHHLWDMSKGLYHWLEEEEPEETAVVGDYSAIRRSYVIEDLLADFEGCNVVKSVHIQAEYGGDDQVWETAWLQSVADEHGYPHAIVAKTDLASETARAELERHGEYPNMRGVRNFVQGDDLATPEFRRGLQALSDWASCTTSTPPGRAWTGPAAPPSSSVTSSSSWAIAACPWSARRSTSTPGGRGWPHSPKRPTWPARSPVSA